MEIDHRGRQVSVAEILLDQFDADPSFEKMGCIAMPKCMRADSTVIPIELFENGFDDTLNRRFAHGLFGGRSLQVVLAFRWENPFLVAMSSVVIS